MGDRRGRAGWKAAVWPVAVITLLCLVFFWDVLRLPSDQMVAGNDLANMFLPWLRFASSSVEHGQLPLWNPYLSSGLPFAANPQPALFYPPSWLALVLPVTTALNLLLVLHLWLAGIGAYGWIRSEGASRPGALLSAVVYAFSGYLFVRLLSGHLGVIATQAWLPFLFWGLGRAVKDRSWKLTVVAGVPVGLSILAGHTASFVLVALAMAAYAAFLAWGRWAEHRSARAAAEVLGQAAAMLLVGVGLAAVQLVPMAELVYHSSRQASAGYEFATRFSWPPGYLITLLVPNFFGDPVRTGYWGDGIYDEFILYVGVLPLMLALLGLRLRHRLVPFLGALGLGGLLVAFGSYGSAHQLLYRFLPLFQLMRAPARAGFLFVLAAAAIAGLTVSAVGEAGEEERKKLLQGLSWARVGAIVAVAAVIVAAGFGAFAWGREQNPAAARLWHQANATALFAFYLLLAAALLLSWRAASRGSAVYWTLALGLVVLDLWTFGGGAVQPADVRPSDYWSAVAEAVPDADQARVLPWGLNDFHQNGGMEFGLRSVFGYDPLILQRYEEFISSRPDTRARTYDLLNVGYVVSGGPLDFGGEEWPQAPRLVLEQGGAYVYERPDAMPRAWVAVDVEVADDVAMLAAIHDPDYDLLRTALVEEPGACEPAPGGDPAENAAEIVRYEANDLEVLVSGRGGLLVLSEVDYPGWRATIDGSPAELVRADYTLRGVCVPAGEHSVELVYDPPLLRIGLAGTGITAALLVALGLWWAMPIIRRSRQERA